MSEIKSEVEEKLFSSKVTKCLAIKNPEVEVNDLKKRPKLEDDLIEAPKVETFYEKSFKIFFEDKFVSFLLKSQSQTFDEVFDNVDNQWKTICPTLKASYDVRSELRQQHGKVDKVFEIKEECRHLFESTLKTIQSAEKASSEQISKAISQFFNQSKLIKPKFQDWNDLSEDERTYLCQQIDLKSQFKEESPKISSLFETTKLFKTPKVIVVPLKPVSDLCPSFGCNYEYKSLAEFESHVSSGNGHDLICPVCPESTMFELPADFTLHLNLHIGLTQVTFFNDSGYFVLLI